MGLKPEDVLLHEVDTSKGHWGIFIQSIVRAQDTDSLFLKRFLSRTLMMSASGCAVWRCGSLHWILRIRNSTLGYSVTFVTGLRPPTETIFWT